MWVPVTTAWRVLRLRMKETTLRYMAELKYLGMIVTDENYIEVFKCKLNSGNACYYSIHNLLFSHLLSKDVKIKT